MASNDRKVRRTVRVGALDGGRPSGLAVGDRCRVTGYHRNYTPTIAAIDNAIAVLYTPELPDGDRHFVKVTRLERIA
jgi:hypothetical protein